MFTLGVTNEVKDGILIEYVSSSFEFLNPTFYKQLIVAGGAMACKTTQDITLPGVTYVKGNIVILSELKEYLGEEKFAAILEHEMAHIRHGDIEIEGIENGKHGIHIDLEIEKAADAAAAKIHGPQVMIDALTSAMHFQITKIARIKNQKVLNFMTKWLLPSIMKKRFKALKAMM